MDSWIFAVVVACAGLALFFFLFRHYKQTAFKRHQSTKPGFDLFPKYEADIHYSPAALRRALTAISGSSSRRSCWPPATGKLIEAPSPPAPRQSIAFSRVVTGMATPRLRRQERTPHRPSPIPPQRGRIAFGCHRSASAAVLKEAKGQ